jgi:hypothetical protein
MPCEECENGKWRWGESGECQYDSKSQCEESNADYYNELDYDWEYNFSEKQMEELHNTGELEVKVAKEEKEIKILFTYKETSELEEAYSKLAKSMLDDELDEYIDRLAESIKQL